MKSSLQNSKPGSLIFSHSSLIFFLITALVLLIALLQVPAAISVGAGKQEAALGNFYPTEHNSNRDYRWTKEVSRVNTRHLSYDEQITLYLDGSRPVNFPPSPIAILVDGQPAATIPATNGPITYTFTYHDLNILPDLSLELRAQQTFYPSDKDYRELGVIFYGLKVESAPGPFGLKWPPLLVALLWLLVAVCIYALGGTVGQRIRFSGEAEQNPSPTGGGRERERVALHAPSPSPSQWEGSVQNPSPAGGGRERVRVITLALPFITLALISVFFLIISPIALLPWLVAGLLVLLPLAVFVKRRSVEAALARVGDWLAGRRLWRNRVARVVAVPAFYLVATIIFTWPYILSFGSRLPGWPMDNFNFMYKIWWVSHAIFGHPPPGSSIVFNPNVYYPVGFNLAQGEFTPANTLLTIPITATLGPIVSYNLLVFLSFVLSGWAMYLLVKYLLSSPLPTQAEDLGISASPPSPFQGEGSGVRVDAAQREGSMELASHQGVINHAPTAGQASSGEEPTTPHSSLLTPHSLLIALLVGLAFTFAPYRLNHMLGHLQMLGTQWLPLTFLFLEKMLRGRRWQDGALAGLFFALCCWEAWYYAAIIGLFVAIYIIVRWWQLRRADAVSAEAQFIAPNVASQQGVINHAPTSNRDMGQQGVINHAPTKSNLTFNVQHSAFIIAFIAVTTGLVAPFAIPYLALRSGNSLAYTVKAANGSSALLSDYFIPSQLHPIWGDTFKTAHTANLNLTEYNLWPGAAMYLLIALGIWAGWRWRGRLADFPFSLYLGMGLLAVVLSFGLEYDLSGELARFNPALRNESWRIPLPGLLLYKYVPLFSSIRAWARFGVVVIFACYVVAALGLAWLLARPRLSAYRYTIVTALAVLILADIWATPYTWGFSRVEEQPLDAYLAALPGQPVVAMMPIDRATRDGPAMWASVYHGKPIAYGYETFMPNEYQRNEDALLAFPKPAALNVLKGWQVQYVAVSSYFYGRDWPEVRDSLATNPRLKFIQTFRQHAIWDGDVGLFDVRPDIEWHAVSDEVSLYELVRLSLGPGTSRLKTSLPSHPLFYVGC